jgi:hypothetical protein
MLTRSARAFCVAAAFAAVLSLALTDRLVLAQAQGAGAAVQAGSVARIEGKPNLSGIWQAVTEAHWDLEPHPARPGPAQFGALFAEPGGLGVVDGGAIPYQPWAAEKKKENFAKRWESDPIAKCFMPGVPRATYMPYPFQIVQGTGKILISYAFANSSRLIHMTPVDDSPGDTWMGWSRGRWDGDTLVVDVSTFLDSTWFDRAGNFHSEALRVVERYTPSGPNLIQYEATIEDPKVFTRPWKIALPLYRRQERQAQLVEFQCIPFAEELLYGNLRRRTN